MSRTLTMLLVSMSTLAAAVDSWAVVPSPGNSTVDPCLVICPSGDFVFQVTVRDLVNSPIPGSTVVLDFCPAPSVHLCPPVSCSVQQVTDAAGQVRFALAGGGVTAPGTEVTVRADGVQLASRPVASPDQDGSLFVDAADVAIANTKLGAADPTMDLDCDQGVVDAGDLAVLQAHLGHTCGGVTPTRPSTWGSVKTLYR